jgi:hypothetical protein
MSVSVRNIYKFVNDTLNGDATLLGLGIGPNDVFAMKAPESHPTPFILTERQAGTHSYSLGDSEAFVDHWMVVKAVTTGTDGGDLGRQIMDRVNALIVGASFTVIDGYSIRVTTVTEMEYVDAEPGNIQFFHIGSMYRFTMGND